MDTKKTAIEQIVGVIQNANRPMKRKEIEKALKENKVYMAYNSVGVYLFNATMKKILIRIEIPPAMVGYYCNPDWVENGKLKEEYNFNPYWNEN